MAKVKVKFLTAITGNINARRGDVREIDSKEAERHVTGGNAVYVEVEIKPAPAKNKTKGKTPVIETR